jgi:DNA-binding transcriptional ArsR family regulator
MAEPRKIRKTALAVAPMQPRQMSIAFESSVLRRLSDPERLKALTHLAHLLMLAAGVAAEERDDER